MTTTPSAPASVRIALVVSRFNTWITEALLKGAQDAWVARGHLLADCDVVHVPGAWELPLTAQRLAQSGRYAGVVALGAVIRGETPHFEVVVQGCTQGLMQAQLTTHVPITLGVITTDTVEQALSRCGIKTSNKGADAVHALCDWWPVLVGCTS